MIMIAGHLAVAPEHAEEFAAACREITIETHKEPGCLFYEFWADLDRTGRFSVVEAWATEADFEAHIATPHLREFRRIREGLGMLQSDFVRYDIAEVKPL